MHDLASVGGGEVADKPYAGESPQLRKGVIVDEAVVLNLPIE